MSIYLSYLYSLIIIIGLELSLLKPEFFWWAALAILVFNVFFIYLATHRKLNINFFNFLISPFLFLLSGLLFLLFSDSFLIKEIIIIFLVITNSIFLRRLIFLNYYRYQYKNHSLSNISRIINVTTIFFFFSGLYNLHVFLRLPLWFLSILSFIVVALTIYQYFCITKITTAGKKSFIYLSSLVLVELFIVIHWLPFAPFVKALLMTSSYYFIINLSKHYLAGTLVRQAYLRYSLIVGLIWVITLLTARWT